MPIVSHTTLIRDTNTYKRCIIMKKVYILAVVAALSMISFGAKAQEQRTSGFWLDVSLGTGEYASLPSAHTVYSGDVALGYRFNPHLALGAGVEIINGIKSNALSLPVFLRFRYDILDKMVSPFVSVNLGYVVTPSKNQVLAKPSPSADLYIANRYMLGLYDNLTIGVSFRIENGHRIWIGGSGGYAMTGYMEKESCIRDCDLFYGMIRLGYEF